MTFSFINWITSLKSQFIWFSIIISIPSTFLYILEIITILRHKEFHNPFFKLFLIRSVPHLLYTLDSYYSYRLPGLFGEWLYPLYSHFPNWMLCLSYFFAWCTLIADFLATTLILINRWTAITMPINYKKVLDKNV
uniref:Serpentine receptor class gamma n=1 Tax=Meloidogyne hapla TaxID=6305 RepID=A0A1I8AZ42_MELHA